MGHDSKIAFIINLDNNRSFSRLDELLFENLISASIFLVLILSFLHGVIR